MRILLTGGAGYVGSAIAARLIAANHHVVVFDRLTYGGEALLPFVHHASFQLVAGDVRDTRSLAHAARGMDAMIHLAAVVGEPACSVDDGAAWSTNVEGTASTLRAAVQAGVGRLLFVSTCSNYGVGNPDEVADERSPLKPLSRYAEAKVKSEELVLTASGLDPTVYRFGTICGLSARMRFDLLVSEMARAAARGDAISLYTPDAWRPFLHVVDAGRAVECWLDAANDRVSREVFNVVGENRQKRSLADMVRTHYPATRIDITDRAPDQRDYRVTAAKIERVLGFATTRTVEDAFLEVAHSVEHGVFADPLWVGHSAVPRDPRALQARVAPSLAHTP